MTAQMTVIIPAYNPGERLLEVINGLRQNGMTDIIVVDDGSDASCHHVFDRIEPYCTVLVHERNRGKGSALKTAFSYCYEKKKKSDFFITVDADGQHLTEDVRACAEALRKHQGALVLGCRVFDGNTPTRSNLGNQMTKSVLCCIHGIRLKDTQTGLRGFPAVLLDRLLQIPGEHYEYETNMLLALHKDKIPFIQIPIHTVYLDDNADSHFRPVVDSLRIYRGILFGVRQHQGEREHKGIRRFISFSFTSLLSTGIDLLLFFVVDLLLSQMKVSTTVSIFVATAIARVCSSLCNYLINKKLVFRNGNTSSLWKYYLLCSCQMLVSAFLVNDVVMLLHSNGLFRTALKAIIDTSLFFASFFIQKNWVFRPAKKD